MPWLQHEAVSTFLSQVYSEFHETSLHSILIKRVGGGYPKAAMQHPSHTSGNRHMVY